MGQNQPEFTGKPQYSIEGIADYDPSSLEETDFPHNSYAGNVARNPANVELLEVHEQNAQAAPPVLVPESPEPRFVLPRFSRKKALVASSSILVIVLLITSLSLAVMSRRGSSETAARLQVGTQDIQLKGQSGAIVPNILQGEDTAVLINGDLITRGNLSVTSGAYATVLRPASLTTNQALTLPNASGTICLDSNNCNFATNTQLQGVQNQLGQIVIPPSTLVNGQTGAVAIQGTSNQVSVTTANGIIALATPQDIAPISSPTFANLLLNGNFSLSGTVTLPLNCSGNQNGGVLTTNALGQIICDDDDQSVVASTINSPGGTAGRLAMFTSAQVIADSLISQALGTITINGNGAVTGSLSANSLTLTTALAVGQGGTGRTTFTTNGVLYGDGANGLLATSAPTNGQVLLGNAGGVPTFTTISGDVTMTGAGVTAIQANSVALGVDTTGDYVQALGTLTGLSTSGNSGEGSTPTLSVVYGSSANTAVQGNTSITVSPGTNLTGGGSITLGAGGSVTLNVTNAPVFTGNVTAQGGTVTIGSTSQAASAVFHDGNGEIGSINIVDITANRTYTLPDASGTFCLTSANCIGSGGGGAPNSATYITLGNDGTLTNERSLAAGNNITLTDGGANSTYTVATVNNPTFSTSVTTPLLQSSGALAITPAGALTVGATGQAALLQGSTTTITSNGAGNDIVLTSADQIRLTGFDCTGLANGGKLTTDASGNVTCAAENGGPAGGVTTAGGNTNRIALFSGSQTIADSWLLQNGSTLELDGTRNLNLTGGNLDVTGTGTFSNTLTANGNFAIQTGDTFTFNGNAYTSLTGTGLTFSSGSLQTTLGTSVDLASAEVTGILPVTSGGTGLNAAATNGQLLIGNGTGYTLATLSQGDGITITNGSGSITVTNNFGTSVDLGTETTGDYQLGTTGGNGIAVTGSQGEGWSPAIALGALTGNWNQTGGFDIQLNNANSELSILESAGATYFGSIDVGDLNDNRTYTFPDATGTVCLTTGNCAGSGTGVTTAGGNTDRVAKFTGSQAIGDSSISDNGTLVTINGSVNLTIQGGTVTAGTLSQAGTLAVSDGSNNTVSIVATALAGDRTYTLPDAGGPADFCLSTGNCVGGAGGGAPNAAAYLVASLDGTLTNERAVVEGDNIDITDAGAGGNFTVATVQNPTFTTSVTTPQLQSSNALAITAANGSVSIDSTTTIELQDSTNVTGTLDVSLGIAAGTLDAFTVNSAGAITAATGITSSGTIIFSALNCTGNANGGALTADGSGQLVCSDDNGAAAGTITGSGNIGTISLFDGTNSIADSIITQSSTVINIAGSLTLDTALAVAEGGTGQTSFTTNGVLYGNNTSGLNVTAAGTSGQVLVADGSGVPTFVSFSGDVQVAANGATTIQPDSVALGTDTTGDYVATLGAGTGVTIGSNSGEGSSPTISVIYGAAANTAVQGSTTLTCPSGAGNLTGGGTSITLGTGGTCSNLDTNAAVSFGTSVTTPILQSSGTLAITPGGALTVGAISQTALLQGTVTTITSNGAGNDIVLTSADQIRLTGFNCTTFTNGGNLTTDASGNLACANDDGGAGGAVTTAGGNTGRLAVFTGSQVIGDGWLNQNTSTLELDNTRNFSLLGGNLTVNGSGTFNSVVTPAIDTASAVALNIGTTNATQINLNKNVVVAASQSLTLTGGNTASRPGSPTEGMLYYDTDTDQLLTYANGKWQADQREAVLVAANDSSPAAKAAADYIADGIGDQTEINSALTEATTTTGNNFGGGKVYLFAGTYTINASISMPNNTTLAGAGRGTVITIPNSFNTTINAITNSDTTTGTGVTVQDLRLDGNKANQSSGVMRGIYLNGMGGGSGGTARQGGSIQNIWASSWRTYGLDINGDYNTVSAISAFNNDSANIYVQGDLNTVTNSVTQAGSATFSSGIGITGESNTITGNTAREHGDYGIYVAGDQNTITGNTAYDNDDGIQLLSSNDSLITGNTTWGNTFSGIELDTSHRNTVTGNTTYQNSRGLRLNDSNENSISSNAVHANNIAGIELFTSMGNTLSNNRLDNNGGNDNDGIVLNDSDYNTIIGNTITDPACVTTCYAIYFTSGTSDKNYLSGNRFTGSAANAATINDAGTNTIYEGQQTNSTTSTSSDVSDFLFRGSANSATALRVQSATAGSVLTVDTTNSQTILRGINSDAVVGPELLTGNCTGTNWSGTGAGPYTHSSGAGVTLTCTITGGVTSGATYQVSYNATPSNDSTSVTPSIGGATGNYSTGTVTSYVSVLTTSSTANPTFVIDSTTDTGTISNISFRLITLSKSVLTVQNSSGAAALEVRASSITSNTFVGLQSGQANTTGQSNSFFGSQAGMSNTTGSYNVFMGHNAGVSNTTGDINNFIGWNAGYSNTTGYGNNFFGSYTGVSNTTGQYNNFFGGTAGYNNTTGYHNVFIGDEAGRANTTGSQNTFIGNYAGYHDGSVPSFVTLNNLVNATAIGYGSQVQASNSLVLGGQGARQANVGIGTTSPSNLLSVSPIQYSTGTAYQTTTTVTGVGTTFTADMVGSEIVFSTGAKATITGFTNGTTLIVTPSQTVSSNPGIAYRIHRPALQVTASGFVGIGSAAPTANLQVTTQTNTTTAFTVQNAAGTTLLNADTTNTRITTGGDLVASGSATATTATTSGTGSNTTTLTFTGTTSFANGDVLFIDNAGQDYYTRIVSGGNAASVTVSPAVTFETARTVTKYNIQNIGATITDYGTLNNRFFQGYFLGGVVTGAGSTTLSDGNLTSTGTLTLTATNILLNNTSDSATAFRIQNTAGKEILTVDSSAGQVVLGASGPAGLDGKLVVANATNTNTVTIQSGTTSASYTLTLPTALGAAGDCLKDVAGDGVLSFGSCGGGGGGVTPHQAKMSRNTAQSIPDNANTKIAFDTEQYDVGGIADATSTDRFTVSQTGKYLVTATWTFSAPNQGNASVSVYVNGSLARQIVVGYENTTSKQYTPLFSEVLELAANDYVEMYVLQNNAANSSVNTLTSVQHRPTMSVSQIDAAGGGGSTLQAAYDASTGTTTPEIKLDSTRGALDIQDADSSLAGNLVNVRASNGAGLGTLIFNVSTVGVGINLGGTSTTPTADLTFGASGSSRVINVLQAANGNAGTDLSIRAGDGNGSDQAGGNLYLQGGTSTGSGTGGSVIVKPLSNSTAAFRVVDGSFGIPPGSASYTAQGADTFVVPAGITSITVKMWGGGGGGGASEAAGTISGAGGGSGYISATLPVTPGEVLNLYVAGGGGGGGSANWGGGGGGYSSLYFATAPSTPVLIAAGGGGGGGGTNNDAGGDGGAGGGTTGVSGSVSGSVVGGGGGTQSNGGSAGGDDYVGIGGSSLAGGAGSDDDSGSGGAANGGLASGGAGGEGSGDGGAGGGGAGYFGGGGGGGDSGDGGSGGGGGSSFASGIATNVVNTAGSGTSPGNSGDPDRGGAGTGGAASSSATANNGANGKIIINYGGSTQPILNVDTINSRTTINGNFGGNVVTENRSTETSAQTYTVNTPGLAYYISSNSGTTDSSFTTTINVSTAALPATDGTFAFFTVGAVKGVTGGSQTHTTLVQINSVTVSTVATATGTGADTKERSFTVARINGTWRVVGTGLTSAPANNTGTVNTADLAEWIRYTGAPPEPGEVLTVGDELISAKRSTSPYDTKLMGVVTTDPAEVYGADDGQSVRMALTGRVPVKVSLENGPIEPGDMLTSSSTPGYAMKATRAGQVIGTALAAYDGSQTEAKVMTQLRVGYGNPEDDNLTVLGASTFNGNLTVKGLTGVGHIRIDGHIITAGDAPEVEALAAAGDDAVVTVDGNDIAGTLTITTGTEDITAGELIKLTFDKPYGKTPRIFLSPQDDITMNAKLFPSSKSTTYFHLKTTQILPANTTYTLDYYIVE